MAKMPLDQDRLHKFFENLSRNRPGANAPASGPRPYGWFEQIRVDTFEHNDPAVSLKTGPPWEMLSAEILECWLRNLIVVLAQYADGTLLWLDDHSSDVDFNTFMRREHLLEWLPDRLDDLLELLIQTKFSFLGYPRQINEIGDVPPASDLLGRQPIVDERYLKALREQQRKLASVASRIGPPRLAARRHGGYELTFCVWTRIHGRVIRLRCILHPRTGFAFKGEELASWVGAGIAPR
jgi:hypothetical protein